MDAGKEPIMTFDEFYAKFDDAICKADPDTVYQCWTADWTDGKQAHLLGRYSKVEDRYVFPCLCMEELFELFKKGETVGSLVFRAIRHLNDSIHVDLQACSILDFEAVKNNLVLTVYGKDFVDTSSFVGESLCEEIFLGVSLVLRDSDGLYTSAVVTEKLLGIWGVGRAEVFRLAFCNTPKYNPPAIFNLAGVAQECLCGGELSINPTRNLLQSVPVVNGDETLAVMTTGRGTGAVCMFFDSVYAWLKTAYGRFYVMPVTRYDVLISQYAQGELKLADVASSALVSKDILSTKCYSSNELLRMVTRVKEICLGGKFTEEKETVPLAPVEKVFSDVDTMAKGAVSDGE